MGGSTDDSTRPLTANSMSLTTGEELLPNKLRLSCFHDAGAEAEASILAELGRPMCMDIMHLYEEALGRLPVADMPELSACVVRGGHCIGLLDPVSNIILNALNHLCRRRCTATTAGKKNRGKGKERPCDAAPSCLLIALQSNTGLIAFMRTYFRHLSEGQARRYLRLAGADLAVAVQLGEHQQFTPHATTGAPRDLCSGRTQFALKVAATRAEHPVPDDLAMLARLLVPLNKGHAAPLAAVLEKGRPLSVGDVNGILDFFRLQHCAASPEVQVTFHRSPQPTDAEIRSLLFGAEAAGRPAHFFCPVGENHVADVVISRRDVVLPVSSICDLRTPDEMNQKLSACLDAAAATIVKCNCSPPPPLAIGRRDLLTTAPSTAARECDHTRYLKACLADTIHAVYIKAVSLLPHKALHRHLRGILVAGHCYGPMDPASNIILNAIWYDTVFPQPELDTEFEPDILDSESMLRVVVRSLESLVALVSTATGFSQHMAVEYLSYKQCDLSAVLQMATGEVCYKAYVCAGQAGKHPKHLELAAFLMSMAHNALKDTLLTDKAMRKGYIISDAVMEQVYKIMVDQTSSISPSLDHPRLCPPAWKILASRKDEFVKKQKFLGRVLGELLLQYSNQHPWEPVPRLDVICGVKKDYSRHSKFYHVNFLVYYDDVSSARALFFAEVWVSSFQAKLSTSVNLVNGPCIRYGRQVESNVQFTKVYSISRKESETSFCCPLPHYSPDRPYLGRCTSCEPISCKIVHPPSGNHTGANCSQLGELFHYLNFRDYKPSAVDSITESDFVYFDCHRDTKFAEGLNDRSSLAKKKKALIIR
ncbi:hypothetical protein QYE76_021580 [Lolium multiflorum]|uniref:Uncharacterized protein n=1 Tax=Lolium multiflorum TaxID=4521 RepID=A0AAD8RB30_LOLMU|nr:hypothetical protein QYE76_021580 [Lolium multiflorum]